jgi:hypothetical protein
MQLHDVADALDIARNAASTQRDVANLVPHGENEVS